MPLAAEPASGRRRRASALSACAVQMFEVAFSRRMCCSRVCSVSTKPRRPSTSTVSPAMRPGIRRRYASVAAKKPNDGPPKSSRLPSGWPSPTATSTPHSPGGREDRRARSGRTDADDERAGGLGAARQRLDVLDRAEEVRLLEERPRTCRRRSPPPSASASVTPSRSGTSTTVVPEAERVGAQRLARVRVHAARDDEARAAGVASLRQVAGGGHGARALVDARRWRPAAPVSSEIAVWYSNITCSPPWETSGWYGVYGVQELRARHEHVDERRDVVVVHPGAEERQLVLGGDVARREVAQVGVDVLLGHAGRQVERRGRAARPRGSSAKRSSIDSTPIAASIASRSASVTAV